MSVQYEAVGWNRQKQIYDSVLAGSSLAYLGTFVGLGAWLFPDATVETLLIRGLGTAALLLLHVILCIGPACRLDGRFLPLLYNRRHLGVTMFLLALAHGAFAIVQFHGFGDTNPLVSLFTTNTRFNSVADFPFQPLGFFALLILFLMAATSHDFWLKNLSAPVWKRLHMGVYLAYALLIAHVALGALQSETSPILAAVFGAGMVIVVTLHLVASRREQRADDRKPKPVSDGFVEVCDVDSIPEQRAVVVNIGEARVAVFRYDGKISAISNVCRHQGGPLGEGRVLDGCVTCPWHGYQYLPETGSSPPPFKEQVSAFRTRVVDGKVQVHPCPVHSGTRAEPSRIDGNREVHQ